MSSILDRIAETKRHEIASRVAARPLDEVRRATRDAVAPRGFLRALQTSSRPSLIAEVKKASPSQGVIRPDFDPIEVAQAYARVGAQALSVLTDEAFFQGSDDNLALVKAAVPLPVLRKDFMLDPYQIWESRALGADAVLLILRMLDDSALQEMYVLAKELNMDVLVEVHSATEVDRALALGAELIGVNNRDLSNFSTNVSTSSLLGSAKGRAHLVAESALNTREDVERVARWGADSVLIGTAFCREPDIEAAVRRVMGWA